MFALLLIISNSLMKKITLNRDFQKQLKKKKIEKNTFNSPYFNYLGSNCTNVYQGPYMNLKCDPPLRKVCSQTGWPPNCQYYPSISKEFLFK